MTDRFNFKRNPQPSRVSVPVSDEAYRAMLAIANEYHVTVPFVAARMLEVGFEEYTKEHSIPPTPEPEWAAIERAIKDKT